MVVERVWLQQVDYIESICATSTGIRDSEVVPLCESSSEVVRFEDEVIFEFVDLDSAAQISRLESRFKYESVIVFETGHVVWSQILIVIAIICRLITLVLLISSDASCITLS